MTGLGWAIVAAGAAAALLAVPTVPERAHRVRGRPAPGGRGPMLAAGLALVSAAAVLAVTGSLAAAAASSLAVAVGSAAAAIALASRRAVGAAEAMAKLAVVLVNQTTVAASTPEAIDRAGKLVPGPAGEAARRMAADGKTMGMAEAAARFARRVGHPSGAWLGDILVVSASTGARWGDAMGVFEQETAAAAVTARHFHSEVASKMGMLVATVAVGGCVIALTAVAVPDVGSWLLRSTQGAAALLSMSVLAGLLAARPLLGARARLKEL